MLYFSKIKILLVSLFTLIFVYLTFSNFIKSEDSWLDKKINLGLDLQGGSYLLLEIDTDPLIKERIQNKVVPLKKFLNKNNFSYKNFNISSKKISFDLDNQEIKNFDKLFFSEKDNLLNLFILYFIIQMYFNLFDLIFNLKDIMSPFMFQVFNFHYFRLSFIIV